MAKNYAGMFGRFFSKENRMASTYKPVFLRSILDMGDLHDTSKAKELVGRQWLECKNGKIRMDLNFVAVRFAKYYWDMEYSFRLRQSQDPQDANITRLIKAVHESGKKPPKLKDLAKNGMGNFRTEVIRRSIKPEVLIHLLTDMKDLYTKVDAYTIEFDEDIIDFLYKHKIILRKGLNNSIAKYLEKLNGGTPKIAHKIDADNMSRPVLKADISAKLGKIQDSRCFYCKRGFTRSHVDHVIPYNYVFSTDPHNCVHACQQCNCAKSDRLPVEDLFCDVLVRNRTIDNYLNTLKVPYEEESYQRLFKACIKEYNGDDDFFDPE